MPIKKTEAQKKQQLQLKRDIKKEQKQKEFIIKYGNNLLAGKTGILLPSVVSYDKKGNLKLYEPLTKNNNIKKVNKKPIFKFKSTSKTEPSIMDTSNTLNSYLERNISKKKQVLQSLKDYKNKIKDDKIIISPYGKDEKQRKINNIASSNKAKQESSKLRREVRKMLYSQTESEKPTKTINNTEDNKIKDIFIPLIKKKKKSIFI